MTQKQYQRVVNELHAINPGIARDYQYNVPEDTPDVVQASNQFLRSVLVSHPHIDTLDIRMLLDDQAVFQYWLSAYLRAAKRVCSEVNYV